MKLNSNHEQVWNFLKSHDTVKNELRNNRKLKATKKQCMKIITLVLEDFDFADLFNIMENIVSLSLLVV